MSNVSNNFRSLVASLGLNLETGPDPDVPGTTFIVVSDDDGIPVATIWEIDRNSRDVAEHMLTQDLNKYKELQDDQTK